MSTPTTVGGLASRVQRMVNGTRRQSFNYLAAPVTLLDTTISLSDELGGITVGSYLGVDEEVLYVRSVNDSARTCAVRRAVLGTTSATHATDAEVQVDWRWFTADVVDALADEVRSWGPEVFKVGTVDIPLGATSTSVAFTPVRYRHPLLVQRSVTGQDRWLDVSGEYNVVELPTGYFLQLASSARGSGDVRLVYAQDFAVDAIASATTLADIGLPVTLHDAAIYGAAARLLIGDESSRTSVSSQPEPRQAQEVGAGRAIQTGAAYRQLADERVAQEAARLRSKYPYRRF